MSFVGNLANSPGTSGIWGQGGGGDNTGAALDLVNKLKDREFMDFKNKAQFMSELSVKQDRMRNRFNPMSGQQTPTGDVGMPGGMQAGMPQQGGMNVVLGNDPNQMTGYQKGELALKQQGMGLERQKLAQSARFGEEKLGIQHEAQKLSELKNQNIFDTANAKIAATQAALEAKSKTGEDTLKLRKELAKNVEERHKLELAETKRKTDMDIADKNRKFEEVKKMDEAKIKELEDAKSARENSTTTTEVNADGTKKTVTTKKGDSSDMVEVVGPNGQKGRIPRSKLADWNKNHKPQE